ncbi:MAG: hypothetical protein ACREBI_11865 [Nitrosotalea sp.]
MKTPALVVIVGGSLGALLIFIVITFLPIIPPSQKYDISVDPIMVKDNLGTETHVEIKNTGIDPLTNVKVEYGGTAKPDVIPVLHPGEKITLSPPDGSDFKQVTVVSEQGVNVTEQYRIPANALFDHM